VTEPDRLAVEDALRFAGRPARVHDDSGGFRIGVDPIEPGGSRLERRRKRCRVVVAAAALPVDLEDVFEVGTPVANRRDGVVGVAVDDDGGRAAVVEAVAEPVGAEKHRQRHRYRAEFPAGQMRDRVRRDLRQHDADAVPAAHAAVGERVRETVRASIEVGERVRLAATVGIGLIQRRAVGVGVFADEVVGGVVVGRDLPLERLAGAFVALRRHRDVPNHTM